MPKQVALKLSPYLRVNKMLEDIRLLLSFSQEEFVSALCILEKVDFGSLHFTRANTDITFCSSASVHSNYSDISIEVQVKEDDVKRTVEYYVPRSVLRLLKRVKKSKTENKVKKEES